MARLARIVVPGVPHLVVQRGNRGAAVFADDQDRERYLQLFSRYRRRHGLVVYAYCLLPGEVHWVTTPGSESALAECFRGAHTEYALAINRRRRETGHLWQGRFYSCPLDETHFWAAVRLVERLPARAGLAARAVDFAWSSAAAHAGERKDVHVTPEFPPAGVVADWETWLADEDERRSEILRRCVRTGRPCGSPAFLDRLEAVLGRSVRPNKRGRKPGPRAPADPPAPG